MRFGRAVVLSPFPTRSLSTMRISTGEHLYEVRRNRPVRRLCCAAFAPPCGLLGGHDCAAPCRRISRPVATSLASGSVHVCGVHHRSLVLDPDRRRVGLIMTVTEVASKNGTLAPESRGPVG